MEHRMDVWISLSPLKKKKKKKKKKKSSEKRKDWVSLSHGHILFSAAGWVINLRQDALFV